MNRYSPSGLARLVLGCIVLGLGVGVLLTADLGSDGYSTLVNGTSIAAGWSFAVANAVVSAAFLLAAALRRVRPDVGTVVQVVVVGFTVSVVLDALDTPSTVLGQAAYLLVAFPVLALGIATYLGTRLGAGPAEAAAQAWDPPLPFRWSYSILQGGGALAGWLLGASIGVGTVLVIVLLGPVVDLAARLIRVDISPVRT
ncbi:MAG: hypothetical protein JWQ74_1563 [Marmoricola sp.]|nr:hypothetical protein [Marmoricola sp.]